MPTLEYISGYAGVTIGDAIIGGSANRILFEDGSNQVAQSAGFVFDGAQLGINNASPAAMLDIQTNATDAVGQTIQATAGQTANLFQALDSVGAGIFVVEPSLIRGYVQMEGPKDATWTVSGGGPDQAETSQTGQDLTISGGDASEGTTSGAAHGGNLYLRGGTAASINELHAYKNGGTVYIQGGDRAQANSSDGGHVIITGGSDDTDAHYTDGGDVTITGGSNLGGVGCTAGDVIITGGDFEANGFTGSVTISSGSSSALETVIGDLTLTTGTSTGSTLYARDAGQVYITTNQPRTGSVVSGVAGQGGHITITLGGGGDTYSADGIGGIGGAFTVSGGAGGDATGVGGVGGVGTAIAITSGAGGSATGGSGTRTGGASGSITLDIGAVGTGADANGAIGNVNLAVSRGNVGIGTATHDGTLQGGVTIANGTAPSGPLADSVQLYSEDGDLHVQADTNKTLVLDNSVWEDLRVPVTSVKTGGSKDPDFIQFMDDGAGSQGVFSYAFDKTTEEEVYFAVQIPHAWKLGSDIEPHCHWSPSDTDTGNVVWGLEYTISDIGGTFGNTASLSVTDAADGTAKKHQLSDLGTIDMSSYTDDGDVSIMLICRIFRDATDAADTYDADAFLHEIDFHIELDTLGSRQETSK